MVGKVVMKVGEGITGWVADTRRPAVVADVSKEPHWKWVPGLDEDRFQLDAVGADRIGSAAGGRPQCPDRLQARFRFGRHRLPEGDRGPGRRDS